MVTLGVDTHKRSHTVVAVDDLGRQVAVKTTTETTSEANLELLRWASQFGEDRCWALEDCRQLSRRLEQDLLRSGEQVVRVSPKLMSRSRNTARTHGKSDPIDAFAVARAALANPDLPVAQLDGPAYEIRLLVDHREDLVGQRVREINRLRWHLHQIDPTWDPTRAALKQPKSLRAIAVRLDTIDGTQARIARALVTQILALTTAVNALEAELTQLIEPLVPTLLAIIGVGPLTAAKIYAETAGVARFRSKDAYARYNGTAPLPVWSGNNDRVRLSRSGNRQLNAAIHRIVITQLRANPDAAAYIETHTTRGKTKKEAIRALKRKLSDVVYRALLADTTAKPDTLLTAA